jgi:ferredoxin
VADPVARRAAARFRLVLDPIACDGAGVCAELVPELIHLDMWGYPVLEDDAVPPQLEAHARRAVARCPRLALSLHRLPR